MPLPVTIPFIWEQNRYFHVKSHYHSTSDAYGPDSRGGCSVLWLVTVVGGCVRGSPEAGGYRSWLLSFLETLVHTVKLLVSKEAEGGMPQRLLTVQTESTVVHCHGTVIVHNVPTRDRH